MPSLTTPIKTEWTYAVGSPKKDRAFWGRFGTQPRHRWVIKVAGTWTTKDVPSVDDINNATRIIDTHGQSVPGAFVGVAQVTTTVGNELTAAGYSVA